MKNLSLLIVGILLFTSCQNPINENEMEIKVKITHFVPVGWGILYKAKIVEIIRDADIKMKDTILFGTGVPLSYELEKGEFYNITMENTREKSSTSYPRSGAIINLDNEICLIKDIKPVE